MKNRVFMYNGIRLTDPDGSKTPAEVKEIHAAQYPELTTCTVELKIEDGKEIINFKKAVGTKG